MRFPISTSRSLRHFEMNFKPQQLRVITLISVGIKESITVIVAEVGLMEDDRDGCEKTNSIQKEKEADVL